MTNPIGNAAHCPFTPADRILVAGHRGMVGSAVVRALRERGHANLLLPARDQLDLSDRRAVEAWFARERPDVVVVAAARVGGILANQRLPVEFMTENLAIATNVIGAAYRSHARRLLFLGSSCIYPRLAPQPIREEALLSGPLEPTNEAYALAKICGLKLCQYYRHQYGALFHSAMPSNLYGPGDNYHPEHSHVLPALLRRFHEARERGDAEVVVWGTGQPRREFLHVDDLASAILFLLGVPHPPDWVNVGTGSDVTIAELAQQIAQTVGYHGTIRWDPSQPDGTPRKLLDCSRLAAMGWRARISLSEGLRATYASYLAERDSHNVRSAG